MTRKTVSDYVTFVFRNDWRYLLDKTYSTTFTFWWFQVERDRMGGSIDVEFILLGIGFGCCIAFGQPNQVMIDALNDIATTLDTASR